MRKLILTMALLGMAVACQTKEPQKESIKDVPPTKTPDVPTAVVKENPTPTKTESKASWPERPAEVLVEARVEGVMPTVQAVLNQARRVSPGNVPPLEFMMGAAAGPALGLSDPTAIDLALAAGGLLVDVPGKPAGLFYFGIRDEASFRKALPGGSQGSQLVNGSGNIPLDDPAPKLDPKGNALAVTFPPPSILAGQAAYINFIGSYAVVSDSPEAFSLAKSHLEAVLKRELGAPAVWVAVEVDELSKKFSSEMLSEIAKLPTMPELDLRGGIAAMVDVVNDIDEVELRHAPGTEAYHLSFYVKPKAGTAMETRMKKPSPAPSGLGKKLSLSWLAGTMMIDPETNKAMVSWMKSFMPSLTSWSYMESLLDQSTGEFAMMASSSGAFGFVMLYAVKDEAKARSDIRAAFAKEQTISMGTQKVTYSAIKNDAETISGQTVDIVEMKSDSGAVDPLIAESLKKAGLGGPMTTRYAYLPGVVVISIGDNAPELERILKGDPGNFEGAPEVEAAFAELPKDRSGSVFLSVPMLASAIVPKIAGAGAPALPAVKSGAAIGSSVEGDRYRVELVVPIAHILDVVGYVGTLMTAMAGPSIPVMPPYMPPDPKLP